MIDYGHGVLLDTIDRADLPKLREWRNDKRIWRWCRQFDLIAEPHHEKWFEAIHSDSSIRMYLVRDLQGKPPHDSRRGVCGLTSIDHVNRRAEFSLYIADGQRAGLGTAALATLLDHAFQNLGLHCVWGETYDQNPAIEMFTKMGFAREGTRRNFYFREGRFIDAHLVSILEGEWKTARSST